VTDSPPELPSVSSIPVLEEMHSELYKVLLNGIKYGVPKKNRLTGKVSLVKPSAKFMDIARQFQRDNSPEPHKLTPLTTYFN
jgi:hypothetical protein